MTGHNILVVDDNNELLETMYEMLVTAGYEVSVAKSPEDAWVECDSKTFDLILCDLVMPVNHEGAEEDEPAEQSESALVGLHAISEFKKRCPKVPIVAISGVLTGSPLQGIQKFGAQSTISKPFGRDELLSVVELALAGGNDHHVQ